MADAPRKAVTVSSIRYAAGLAFAHLLSVAEVLVIVVALSGHVTGGAAAHFSDRYVITSVTVVSLATLAVLIGGVVVITPSLRWFVPGREPDTNQRRAAMKLMRNQSIVLAATWTASGATFVALDLDGGLTVAVSTGLAVLFGGAAATGTAVLLSQRTVRPIIAAATKGFEGFVTAPGVMTRLVTMWLLCSALPCVAIAVLVFLRANGWIIPKSASVEIPVLVLSIVAVMLGLRGMILVSRSISDPVREVIDAMAEIEHGRIGVFVDVYERSEIGRLQRGFNRMVAGLSERDRLRDLFGRHVGADVARRAVKEGASLSGDVGEAAILFVDLVGSTQLAASRPPEEVAEVLNDFFRIVVGAVDERHGLINKFQGDAALAVFGAPLRTSGAASAALATARVLGTRLRRLPVVDFGIGVSAGSVFAGNIGAENRYEYTVIGDAVNEAARLADLAKTFPGRVLCSAAAVDRADDAEEQHWDSGDSAVLRGRSEATHIWTPAVSEQP
ncbi:adenylate/guanylate cyclase domain-containing protein [Mycobacterium kyorinense]|uniref:adenylate/guanylate cyclase domain-containing protein n=1 Tax=Mycobacterium kyorinense TaxID=487514 RepID=UPI000AAA55C2|nr:adenylate/guanylate cyclase domain-containing protein [Mycobacterium kyorinense]